MSENLTRVLFFTGPLEPHREAISKEVFTLKDHFKKSFVIGTSPEGGFIHSRSLCYLGMPGYLLPSVRLWSFLAERGFEIVHIFQGMDNYHYLKAKGRRPVVLTAISVDNVLSPEHYRRVERIVVESPGDREKVLAHGFPADMVSVIYPGIDLSRFHDAKAPPAGRFKLLFASSPISSDYLEGRGVPLLLAAAREKRDVEFVLLWRRRGDTLSVVRRWVQEYALENVTIVENDVEDMRQAIAECHAVVVPYTRAEGAKSCPNSALESLATGRPVLVSDKVGIADLVSAEESGLVFRPNAAQLAESISRMQGEYDRLRLNARSCAEKHFSITAFVNAYQRLYAQVLRRPNLDS
jgi:glycosyltransferase involved in cell wall biosynthesis